MRKSVRKFFWLFFTSQEQWLNKMSDEGRRLTGTTISGYEFEKCEKGKYRYKVVYIANRSKESAEKYCVGSFGGFTACVGSIVSCGDSKVEEGRVGIGNNFYC